MHSFRMVVGLVIMLAVVILMVPIRQLTDAAALRLIMLPAFLAVMGLASALIWFNGHEPPN
jgi:hypothetical protein